MGIQIFFISWEKLFIRFFYSKKYDTFWSILLSYYKSNNIPLLKYFWTVDLQFFLPMAQSIMFDQIIHFFSCVRTKLAFSFSSGGMYIISQFVNEMPRNMISILWFSKFHIANWTIWTNMNFFRFVKCLFSFLGHQIFIG